MPPDSNSWRFLSEHSEQSEPITMDLAAHLDDLVGANVDEWLKVSLIPQDQNS